MSDDLNIDNKIVKEDDLKKNVLQQSESFSQEENNVYNYDIAKKVDIKNEEIRVNNEGKYIKFDKNINKEDSINYIDNCKTVFNKEIKEEMKKIDEYGHTLYEQNNIIDSANKLDTAVVKENDIVEVLKDKLDVEILEDNSTIEVVGDKLDKDITNESDILEKNKSLDLDIETIKENKTVEVPKDKLETEILEDNSIIKVFGNKLDKETINESDILEKNKSLDLDIETIKENKTVEVPKDKLETEILEDNSTLEVFRYKLDKDILKENSIIQLHNNNFNKEQLDKNGSTIPLENNLDKENADNCNMIESHVNKLNKEIIEDTNVIEVCEKEKNIISFKGNSNDEKIEHNSNMQTYVNWINEKEYSKDTLNDNSKNNLKDSETDINNIAGNNLYKDNINNKNIDDFEKQIDKNVNEYTHTVDNKVETSEYIEDLRNESDDIDCIRENEDSDLCNGKEKENKLNNGKSTILNEVFSYVKLMIIASLIACFINTVILSNNHIPSGSMENTLQEGDRLFGLRLAYLVSEPKRGDIIIFRFPDNPKIRYIKRIIGLPGETVKIENGCVYIDGEPLDEESYIKEEMVGNFGPYIVPKDEYFVLGDNRNHSQDSRCWMTTNYVSKDAIIAKAVLKYYPEIEVLSE